MVGLDDSPPPHFSQVDKLASPGDLIQKERSSP